MDDWLEASYEERYEPREPYYGDWYDPDDPQEYYDDPDEALDVDPDEAYDDEDEEVPWPYEAASLEPPF
jgi:hypothetical protein